MTLESRGTRSAEARDPRASGKNAFFAARGTRCKGSAGWQCRGQHTQSLCVTRTGREVGDGRRTAVPVSASVSVCVVVSGCVSVSGSGASSGSVPYLSLSVCISLDMHRRRDASMHLTLDKANRGKGGPGPADETQATARRGTAAAPQSPPRHATQCRGCHPRRSTLPLASGTACGTPLRERPRECRQGGEAMHGSDS